MARLIDGDALIAWIKGGQQMTSKMKSIICYIKTMPTIEARPKGEWIYHKNELSCVRWSKWECSACGERQEHKSNFCPNCGADMRGE